MSTRATSSGELVMVMMHPTLPVVHNAAAVMPVRVMMTALVTAVTLTVSVIPH